MGLQTNAVLDTVQYQCNINHKVRTQIYNLLQFIVVPYCYGLLINIYPICFMNPICYQDQKKAEKLDPLPEQERDGYYINVVG